MGALAGINAALYLQNKALLKLPKTTMMGALSQYVSNPEITKNFQPINLLLPEVAQVRNPRMLHALRKRVEMLGGIILEQQPVQKIETAGERVVALHTPQGRLVAGARWITSGSTSFFVEGRYDAYLMKVDEVVVLGNVDSDLNLDSLGVFAGVRIGF